MGCRSVDAHAQYKRALKTTMKFLFLFRYESGVLHAYSTLKFLLQLDQNSRSCQPDNTRR